MTDRVLDAWAVMAFLKDRQPAARQVRQLLDESEHRRYRLWMNIVNMGEVFCLSVKARDEAFGERVLSMLRSRISVISATDELVLWAAQVKAKHAISYADAFAAATAVDRQLPLVTGDPELRMLAERDSQLKIEWIGA